MLLSIAIESSTRFASLAFARGGQSVRYLPLNRQSRTATTVSLALRDLLDDVRAADESVDFVAVTDGPGSFTGLRIGVTTAKSLAYALNCPIVAVDSLAVVASGLWNRCPQASGVHVALNAYRGQLFVANWTRQQWEAAIQSGDFTTQSHVVMADDWARTIAADDSSIAIAAEPAVAERSGSSRVQSVEPTAIELAKLADLIAKQGRFTSAMSLLPRYFRDSAAEEKWTLATAQKPI